MNAYLLACSSLKWMLYSLLYADNKDLFHLQKLFLNIMNVIRENVKSTDQIRNETERGFITVCSLIAAS
ncbi:hypothetical protein QS257_05065 [Terrilactibacillus sp. S3-3]|nr:hypothetical protein QS257_05065 [Terrilactibacillus sp. S3-3]